MIPPHVLCVGYDPYLMHSRGMVLRQAGFVVDEAFNLKGALGLVKSDSVDAMLLCHTLTRKEKRWLIAEARDARRFLPIICITLRDYEALQEDCANVPADPGELIKAVQCAVRFNPSSSD